MTQKKEQIGFLYINGLGNGKTTFRDKLVRYWWSRSGRAIEHAHIDWYDGAALSDKEQQVEDKIKSILKTFGGVAMVGTSAGGSLALNVFSRTKAYNVCAIAAHSRVKVGNYDQSDRMSLYRRAKLHTKHPSRAFFDSVTKVESQTIPNLLDADRSRVLSLTQLTDPIVALDLMRIDGVETHRSIAFGHSGGFLAHMFADRDLIVKFAEDRLLHNRQSTI